VVKSREVRTVAVDKVRRDVLELRDEIRERASRLE